MSRFHENPFYDFVLSTAGFNVPSTRTGYSNSLPNPESKSVREFRQGIRDALPSFVRKGRPIPLKGRIFLSIAIGLTPKEFESKDIDNMAKSVIDCLKGVLFVDDKQIDVLHVVRFESDDFLFNFGVKELKLSDKKWYSPRLFRNRIMGEI